MPIQTPICDFGKKAEEFKLKSINNKLISLDDIKGEKATLVIFICNHCPYVKAIIHKLVRDTNELNNHDISSVAIMPNDTNLYPEDNFEEMKTWVGKLATFTYFERTKANSYRHPLFKCIRDYE